MAEVGTAEDEFCNQNEPNEVMKQALPSLSLVFVELFWWSEKAGGLLGGRRQANQDSGESCKKEVTNL